MIDAGRAAIGVFGKAPWRAEYLKLRWDGEPFTSFDSWVTDNVEWAALHAGHAFHEASRSGAVNAFVYRPKNGQGVLAGAILASTDSAGRNFPLIVAAPLVAAGEIGASPEVLPLVLEDFWQQASELAVAVQGCGSVEHASSVAAADFSAGPGPAEARAAYAEWCGSLPLADLFTLVYGEGGVSAAANAVRFVVDAVRPFRAVERPRTPLALRLPLGAAGGAAVCFWVDLVRRAAAWRATVPSFFWSHDGSSGNLLLHLGDAPRSTLADVFTAPSPRGDVCDLTVPLSTEQLQAIAELPAPLARCFASESHVSDLVAATAAL